MSGATNRDDLEDESDDDDDDEEENEVVVVGTTSSLRPPSSALAEASVSGSVHTVDRLRSEERTPAPHLRARYT